MENTSSGTNDAVTEAIEKYSDMVRRICFLYRMSEADVEDIFQEVFLRRLQHRGGFESEEHEKAWLCRVTINQCKDFHKSFFRKNVSSIEEMEIPIKDPTESEVIREVLALPQKYRDVIYLFYYEDYTAAEIARMLHRKENTVYSLLHRARAILKKKLGGLDDGNCF